MREYVLDLADAELCQAAIATAEIGDALVLEEDDDDIDDHDLSCGYTVWLHDGRILGRIERRSPVAEALNQGQVVHYGCVNSIGAKDGRTIASIRMRIGEASERSHILDVAGIKLRMTSFVLEPRKPKGRFRAALGNRRVTPVMPAGRTPRTGVEPDEAPAHGRDASSSWSAFIRYVNAKGEESQRRLTCRCIEGFQEATLIWGYCHEKKAVRSFRVDRIKELVCCETGEYLEPVPHFELLRMTGALEVKDPVLTDVAKLLVFLARCDGDYHPLERAALEQHIGSYCVRFNGTDKMAEHALDGCKRLAPDSTDMVLAIRRLARAKDGPRLSRFVLDCGAAVIDADGRHAPEEVNWAVEMSSALKRIADRAI